jgi:hypothetical protein
MKKYIVTTTINHPTLATMKFSQMEDWKLIVVGDTKTPHEDYENLNCIYLTPEYQEQKYKALSDSIGWRSIQRRNIGFVEAYNLGADIIATVDDDNIPYNNWGQDLKVGHEIEFDLWESDNGYFDPLSVTNRPDLWHRGYPISHVPSKNNVNYMGKSTRKVLVQANLWDGDPDIDALCRLSNMPCVKYDINSPYGSNQISPFNSQNTFLAREVIPHYMVIPHVGRMDDIWGSYIIQLMFPNSVVYDKPTVYQDRNEQDLVTNLENEVIGYRNTLKFIHGNHDLNEKADKAYKCYRDCFEV